jgi:hypothetical protein
MKNSHDYFKEKTGYFPMSQREQYLANFAEAYHQSQSIQLNERIKELEIAIEKTLIENQEMLNRIWVGEPIIETEMDLYFNKIKSILKTALNNKHK